MKTIPAGEFKARCLRVMEEVKKYRTSVVITKKGRPVAKLVPPDEPATDVFGCMAGSARIVGDIEAPAVAAQTWSAVGRKSIARRAKRPGVRRAPR
jgi:prevent-host-death family protein